MVLETPFVFVYGTLKPGSSTKEAGHLAERARLVGKAFLVGELYHLGTYPGAREIEGRAVIHGYVYRLFSPNTLKRLDAYEEVDPATQTGNTYYRKIKKASLSSGQGVPAWVYLYHGPFSSAARIPSGVFPVR